MRHRWLPIPTVTGELLSSYLSRCARIHGLPATIFGAVHLPQFPLWARDLDRSAPTALVEAVADLAQLPPARVHEMTLKGWERFLQPVWAPDVGGAGAAAWITTVGIYHRTRRRYGLQYCRWCLRESPVFLTAWRLAAVTTCQRHQTPLSDACPRCEAPIIPHRQHHSARHCHACSADLTQGDATTTRMADTQQVVERQQRFLGALDGQAVTVGSQLVSGRDYLHGLHLIATRLRLLIDRTTVGTPIGRTPPLECQRVPQRRLTLQQLGDLVDDWPTQLCRAAERKGVTRRAFVAEHSFPGWITEGLDHLPAGSCYDRTKRPRCLRLALRRLHRRRPSGWRTERARLLLSAAGCRV